MMDRRAKRPIRAAAALALGLGVAAAPGAARAQFFGGWGGWDDGGSREELAPGQIRRGIAQQGFRVLAPLRRNGGVYVADVLDGRGRHERLIVAAADAQIMQRFMVDDGRAPLARDGGGGSGFGERAFDDDDRGLVPPADIPDGGRRVLRPAERDAPVQRFGDLGTGADAPADADPALRRLPPPIRTVRPRPRVVDRSPDAASPARQPGAVEATPLAPAVPRAAPAPAPAATPTTVASRPEPSATAAPSPAAPAPSAQPAAAAPPAVSTPPSASTPPPASAPPTAAASPASASASARRPSDPLAIPGDGDARPVRNVAAGITGTPVPAKPAPAARPGDVPVAPLD